MKRVGRLAACVILAGAGFSAAGCGGASPSAPYDAIIPRDGAGFTYNGATHVSWWHDSYGGAIGTESRRALSATGAGWGGLLVTWYMDTKRSSVIGPDANRSNDDVFVRAAIDEMHALGLKVMLKPHVDVQDGTWRAEIAPDDPDRWFESYAAFIDHYLEIAAEKKVAMLCIGTELASMSGARYASRWATLIERIRSRYGGLLTYAANGVEAADEFTSVSFWDRVDLIGVDAYTPLTDQLAPTRAALAAAWRRNRYGHDMLAAFRNLHQAHGKPIIFTEVGYRSADGANRAPWDYQLAMTADPEEQADCYAALYQVWSQENAWMRGVFWWAWDVKPPAAGDTGYNPRGKPAEEVMRLWQR